MSDGKCTCGPCPECDGHGFVYFSFGHRDYLGKRRCDDLDEIETCEECRGLRLAGGICDYCCLMVEDEEI